MPAQGQLAQRNRRDDDTLYERYMFFLEPLYEQRNSIQDQYDVGSESSWEAIQRMLASVSFFVENISRAGLCSSCL